MQQYFALDKNLNLNDSDYHHIKNVMRMKKGDKISIVYDNYYYECVLTNVHDKCEFDVINKTKCNSDYINITLAFSLIKEQRLDYLLQKSCEVGVSNFIPLITKRTIIKLDKSKYESKIIRWQKICKEASEQSHRNIVPNVNDITNLKNIDTTNYDLKLVCSLNESAQSIKKVLKNNKNYDKILLVIGPEGGLEKEEEKYLTDNGFILVSLGENVLRAESVGIVAVSMINYEVMR